MSNPEIMRNIGQVVNLDIRKAIQHVERTHGLSQWQQFKLMRQVARGPGKVPPVEFFNLGLHRPSLTDAQRKTFLTNDTGSAVNSSLNRPELQSQAKLMTDKFGMAMVIEAAGQLAPTTLALLDTRIANRPKLGTTTVLHSTAEISAFLKSCPLPIFGKPRYASRTTGVFNLFDRSADGMIGKMGNGREFNIDQLAAEIMRYYAEGYMFQEVVRSIPAMLAYSDIALSTFRITTLQSEKGAEVLYICWRASGKGALADNFYYEGTAHCFVDHKTCTVARAQMGNQTFGGEVEVHAPTGLPLKGLHIPELEAAKAAACELHDMFPEHGIIGWDVALTPRGPLFVEANHNPIHGTYQITADRGFLNEEFVPRLEALKALQAERVRMQAESSEKIKKSMLRNALVGMRLAKPKT